MSKYSEWVEDIVTAFRNLGGSASFGALLEELESIRSSPLEVNWQDIVREIIEDGSSNVETSQDEKHLFYGLGSRSQGIWAIRSDMREDIGLRVSPDADLRRYQDYTRKEVHDIFAPYSPFTPSSGTWGIRG